MKLDLNEIAHSIGMQYTFEVDEDDVGLEESGIGLADRFRGKLIFSNTGGLLLVRGTLKGSVTLECVRCLREFPCPQILPIEEQFPVHAPTDWRGGALQEEDEPDEETDVAEEGLFQENILDLSELIRQNLLATVPMAPLCSEHCAGLCPRCGKNLNEGACACEAEVQGPLAQLGELLSEPDKGSGSR